MDIYRSQLFLTSTIDQVAKDIATRTDSVGKKLAFIYTAAEVEEGGRLAPWMDADRKALAAIGFDLTDYTISNKTKGQLESDLASMDAVYVSGGNTFYLLQQAQKSGFTEVIRDLVINKEKTYLSTSAGSIIAGPDTRPTLNLDDISRAPALTGYDGFGLVNFCVMPHWGSDHFRDRYLNQRLDHAYIPTQVPLLCLTDNQYVHVQDNRIEIIDITRHDTTI